MPLNEHKGEVRAMALELMQETLSIPAGEDVHLIRFMDILDKCKECNSQVDFVSNFSSELCDTPLTFFIDNYHLEFIEFLLKLDSIDETKQAIALFKNTIAEKSAEMMECCNYHSLLQLHRLLQLFFQDSHPVEFLENKDLTNVFNFVPYPRLCQDISFVVKIYIILSEFPSHCESMLAAFDSFYTLS